MYRFFIGVLITIGLFASWQFLKAGQDQLAMAVLASGAFIAIGLLAIADNLGAVKTGQKLEHLPPHGCNKGSLNKDSV